METEKIIWFGIWAADTGLVIVTICYIVRLMYLQRRQRRAYRAVAQARANITATLIPLMSVGGLGLGGLTGCAGVGFFGIGSGYFWPPLRKSMIATPEADPAPPKEDSAPKPPYGSKPDESKRPVSKLEFELLRMRVIALETIIQKRLL